jgi:hypothetical protein
MSRIEKFQKKWGAQINRMKKEDKKALDTAAILEAQHKEALLDKEQWGVEGVSTMAREYGLNKEDIAFVEHDGERPVIIANHEGARDIFSFIGNSVQHNVNQAMQPHLAAMKQLGVEIANLVRATVREEVQAMAQAMAEGIRESLMTPSVPKQPEPKTEMTQRERHILLMDSQAFETYKKAMELISKHTALEYKSTITFADEKEEVQETPTKKEVFIPRKMWNGQNIVDWKYIKKNNMDLKEVLFGLLQELEEQGINIRVGNQMVQAGQSSVYHNGLKEFGSWKEAIAQYENWKQA